MREGKRLVRGGIANVETRSMPFLVVLKHLNCYGIQMYTKAVYGYMFREATQHTLVLWTRTVFILYTSHFSQSLAMNTGTASSEEGMRLLSQLRCPISSVIAIETEASNAPDACKLLTSHMVPIVLNICM